MISTLYKKFSESPIYLEEHNHVYVHKNTGQIYNSVTTALSLIKHEFNKDGVIDGIINQYNTFCKWYFAKGGSKENIVNILRLYVTYNKKRPFVLKNFNGKENKVYRRLSEYSSIIELEVELKEISKREGVSNKAIYLNPDYSVMSKEQILATWDVTNLCSRHYGHMIHESIETFLLESQGFTVNKFQKLQNIQGKYNDLQELLNKTDKTFNEDFFAVYNIDIPVFQFMDYIIEKFKMVKPDLGLFVIPEKLNFSPSFQICGMSDAEIIFDDINFKIGDHKTNKKFTFTSEYGNFLQFPFDDMEDCEMSAYTLQLNCYGLIQEVDYERKYNGGWITYFSREKKQFELVEIPIVLDKAEKLLTLFKNRQAQVTERYLMSGILNGVEPRFHNFIAKLVHESIEKRRKNNTIDVNDKNSNKIYYENFVNKTISNLKMYI